MSAVQRRRRRPAPYVKCKFCQAAIRFVELSTGAVVPLDVTANDDGTHVLTAATSAAGFRVARVLTRGELHEGNRFTAHKCRKRRAS